MKRILCFIDSINYGGAQRQFVEMSSLLQSIGYCVNVIYYQNELFYDTLLQNAGVEFRQISYKSSGVWKYLHISKATREYIHKFQPDVVIAYLRIPCIISCLLKGVFGEKYRLIVSERNTTQKIDLVERLRFWAYRYADIIVPNSHTQELFIQVHFPALANKVTVITNCVDTTVFCPSNVEKTVVDRLNLICVGRVHEQKNVVRFLHVTNNLVNKVRPFHIVWYGDTNSEYGRMCEALVNELNLSEVVEFRPLKKDIQVEYRKADALCLPSIYEGFPNVIGEGMSCGLPILCSNVCDNAALVDATNGMLFDPFDVEDMEKVMTLFCSLPSLELMKMGKNSRAKALTILSKDTFVNKYQDIIESY